MSKKLVVSDGTRERELQLVGRIVVGRDPTCDVSHDHSLLSRRHAEFVTAGDRVVVRDLGSRNGVFVNGSKTAEQPLHPGDVVQIGPLRAEYVADDAPLSIAPEDHDTDRTAVIHPDLDADATRLMSAPRSRDPEETGTAVTNVAVAPVLDVPIERPHEQQVRAPVDTRGSKGDGAVSGTAESLRTFVFVQLLVLGGLILAVSTFSLRANAPAPSLTILIVPVVATVVAGYLVSGIIDRRFARAFAERRRSSQGKD